MSIKGHFLVPTPHNPDKGLWFIFHHESDGVLAFDLTCRHPDIPYRHFEQLADGEPKEKIVLFGGPEQSSTAMIILHNDRKALPDPHGINNDFIFFSRKFLLLPGQPPVITDSNETPSKISLSPNADFIITMGFRLWIMDDLEQELKNWHWNLLPATPEIVFHTKHTDRLKKARGSIN